MYEYFCGVANILVPDNCKSAVVHIGGWKDQQIRDDINMDHRSPYG